jgi:putative tryptophan/tyrosine transport system substrate-binding protein
MITLFRRRLVVAGALGALAPAFSFAQARPVKIGMLSGSPLSKSALAPILLKALADLGYRDGAGMVLEYRHSDDPAGYPARARELIARKCDIIFAFVSESAARALLDAHTDIPVVLLAFDYDPVEKGIVRSYARPGGNMTGVYTPVAPLTTKRLEIAQEVLPKAKRFLVLSDSYTADQLAVLRKAAEARRIQLTISEFTNSPYNFRAAFEAGRRERVDAVWLFTTPEFSQRRAEISALLLSHRQPGFSGTVMSTSPGVLVGYGHDLVKGTRRGAEIAVKVLKGASAGDTPVEQADEFELVVNLKTATTLGIKVPQSVRTRATTIIE